LAQVPGTAKQPPTESTNKTADAGSKTNQTWGFTFTGGTPRQFVEAIDKYYKTDWANIVQIPVQMERMWIPRMRLPTDMPLASHPIPTLPNQPAIFSASLLSLYADLAAKDPELGNLIVKGDPMEPNLVIFIPDKSIVDAPSDIRVKAFSLQKIPKASWPNLLKEIDDTQMYAARYAEEKGANQRLFSGRSAIHADTQILVAIGTDAYVTMVQSVEDAFTSAIPWDHKDILIKPAETNK
jgi:hypothetical protein